MMITLKNGEQCTHLSLAKKLTLMVGSLSDTEIFFLMSAFYNKGDIRKSPYLAIAQQLGYTSATFILEAISLLSDEVIDQNDVADFMATLNPLISATHMHAEAILRRYHAA